MRAFVCLTFIVILFSSFGVAGSPTWSIATNNMAVDDVVVAAVTEKWTYSTGDNNGLDSGITLADIDMDGKLEAIGGTWGNDRMHAVNAEDGSPLWNASIGDQIRCTPAVGDIDGDSKPEVVFCSWDGKTYALNGEDGSQLWNTTTGSVTENGLCLGDVNNDANLDVIMANGGGTVYALNGINGSILWSTHLAKGIRGSPAIGDIDQDGELEVVACTIDYPSYMYSLNATSGAIKWTAESGGYQNYAFYGHPSLADLDGDGQVEVIATTSYSTGYSGHLVVVNGSDGSVIWVQGTNGNPYGSPSVGDIDGDGKFEVCVAMTTTSATYLRVYDHLGNQQYAMQLVPLKSFHTFTPILTDLNNDNRLDILIETEAYSTAQFWGIEGRTGALLFQQDTGIDIINSGAVGDIDSDGSVDFVIGIMQWDYAGMRAYDLGSSGRRLYWQSQGGVSDTHSGCLVDIDPDRDGLSSEFETYIGTNPLDWDSDSDLMADGFEVSNDLDYTLNDAGGDLDSDGLSNLEEYQIGAYPDAQDSDGDGMPDLYEATWGLNPGYDDSGEDPDSDSLNNLAEYTASTNPFNNDTDSDTMPDGYEVQNGINPLVDDRDDDPDSDTLTNIEEFNLGTKPMDADSEDDGMPDGWEYNNSLDPLLDDAGLDPDNDQLTNLQEYSNNCNPQNNDTDSDLIPDGWEVTNGINPLTDDAASDPDSDTLTNLQEYQFDTDPLSADSDSDELDDYEEIFTYGTNPNNEDSDSDSMPDGWEIQNSLDPLNAADAATDADSDGLSNLQEYTLGTDPNLADTDGDGLSDKEEVDQGLDPLVPNAGVDSDNDGLNDLAEAALGTDPLNPDTDSDGLPDGWEVARGLDPLQLTTETGEAIERIVITAGLGFGLFAIVFLLTRKFENKIPARGLRIMKGKPLLFPAVALFIIVILMVSFDVMGPIDPGSNIKSFTTGGRFEVKDSPYLSTTVNVYASYEMHFVETNTVTVTFTGPVTRSVSLTITSTSPEVKIESDSDSIGLIPGNYTVSISSWRTVTVKLTQVHLDGRNVDQKIWLAGRAGFLIVSIGLLYVIYKRKPTSY